MKTKEELNALKEEVETLNRKLAELTEEELAQVTGGVVPTTDVTIKDGHSQIIIQKQCDTDLLPKVDPSVFQTCE